MVNSHTSLSSNVDVSESVEICGLREEKVMSLLFCVTISLPYLHSTSPHRAARATHCLKAKNHEN